MKPKRARLFFGTLELTVKNQVVYFFLWKAKTVGTQSPYYIQRLCFRGSLVDWRCCCIKAWFWNWGFKWFYTLPKTKTQNAKGPKRKPGCLPTLIFHWRTGSFRGKSIVKVVTPGRYAPKTNVPCFSAEQKNTCHSSSYFGATDPLRQEVYRENATFTIFPGKLAGGFKYFLFSPLPGAGETIQFDEHIFQLGRLNHQLVNDFSPPWSEHVKKKQGDWNPKCFFHDWSTNPPGPRTPPRNKGFNKALLRETNG